MSRAINVSCHAAAAASAVDTPLPAPLIETVCARIAPTWPLDQLIAVTPYWGWIDHPFLDAAGGLKQLCGSSFFMPRGYYRQKWQDGAVTTDHLKRALTEILPDTSIETALDWLALDDNADSVCRLLSDALDARSETPRRFSWNSVMVQQISQFCASHFDKLQSDWRPAGTLGLYEAWRLAIQQDRGIGLLTGRTDLMQKAKSLPDSALDLIQRVTQQLALPKNRVEDYLLAALLSINGWAAWCAYQRWQARLEGKDDDQIVELLAIRLAWEWLIDDGRRDAASVWASWQASRFLRDEAAEVDRLAAVWQRADEIAYQTSLCRQLMAPSAQTAEGTITKFQAVFCIDVRSEVFRRALEQVTPEVQTIGFAGFFGLPIRYEPLGTQFSRPQLPGLLAPTLRITDTTGQTDTDQRMARARSGRLAVLQSWRGFQKLPVSSFSMVESMGLTYLGKLLSRSLGFAPSAELPEFAGLSKNDRALLRPCRVEGDLAVETRVSLVERALRAIGLTNNLAPLVLFVGHGSECANNPHRAGLDCGACGGQTGEVNARTLAALANQPEVRNGLSQRGIVVPDTTWFIAGLHNTTTDEVTLFEIDRVPPELMADVASLSEMLMRVGHTARCERAIDGDTAELQQRPDALLSASRRRARDWAETRPEWGLAGNAAFVVAPRSRTRGLNLAGRCFLHDYDWRADTTGAILEMLLTAPMIVTHWINMQYFASTVDNRRFGSGNKVLHNVVGGNIGVFEGNSGDLRIGLAMQSLHNGNQWRHSPVRLSVLIQAPTAMIDAVINKHKLVRQLVDHEWLYLFQLSDEPGTILRYQSSGWRAEAS